MALQYLEDFEVGQVYATGHLQVDAAAIKRFAAAFDPQPFHLEDGGPRDRPHVSGPVWLLVHDLRRRYREVGSGRAAANVGFPPNCGRRGHRANTGFGTFADIPEHVPEICLWRIPSVATIFEPLGFCSGSGCGGDRAEVISLACIHAWGSQ
jgi:hypothetical protein